MKDAPRSRSLIGCAFTVDSRAGRVVFGEGSIADVGHELARLGVTRALGVCTPGRAATMQSIRSGDEGERIARVFDGAREHVPADLVDAVMAGTEGAAPDAIVAVGGGSAVGLAKAIALRTTLPILAVPTTYSGSEMTSIWGITKEGRKTTGRDDRVAPRVVIYDPGLTRALPTDFAITSGLNAIAHAVESLYAPDANPVASVFAKHAIEYLGGGLRALRSAAREKAPEAASPGAHGPDAGGEIGSTASALAAAMLGAHLAGRALDLTRMGLHHRLCHALGGEYDTPHALTHAILLPFVAAFLLPAAPEAAEGIASALGGSDGTAALYTLRSELGVRSTLRDLGLAPSDLDRIATVVAPAAPAHPRQPTVEDVRVILDAAWAGTPARFSRTRP